MYQKFGQEVEAGADSASDRDAILRYLRTKWLSCYVFSTTIMYGQTLDRVTYRVNSNTSLRTCILRR